MARTPHRHLLIRGALFAALLLPGCAGPGLFGLGTEGQRLLPVTEDLRLAAPEPLPLPRELDKALHPTYVVEPGDILLVQPAEFESPARLPGDQPVLPDGTIHLGRYGQLVVAGKTIAQIEADVRRVVEAETEDAGPIIARVVSRQSKVFYVLGEVNAPGAYALAGRETVLDALMVAGGANYRANLRGITLSRPTPPDGCRVVLPVCYEEIVQLGDTSTNYQVAAGDRIFVPARTFFDDLFQRGNRDICPPCGRSQVPCTLLHGNTGTECGAFRPIGSPDSTPRYHTAAPPTPAVPDAPAVPATPAAPADSAPSTAPSPGIHQQIGLPPTTIEGY